MRGYEKCFVAIPQSACGVIYPYEGYEIKAFIVNLLRDIVIHYHKGIKYQRFDLLVNYPS